MMKMEARQGRGEEGRGGLGRWFVVKSLKIIRNSTI